MKNTLIIYDWDDTLFPTSKISYNNNSKDLELLADLQIEVLKRSMYWGKVAIITNASSYWVIESAYKHMRKLIIFIVNNKIDIMSAREFSTDRNITNYYYWKNISFYYYINNIIKNEQKLYNIISIGDSTLEKEALITVGRKLNIKLIKTVKYIDNPTINQLIEQSKQLIKNIHKIVLNTKNQDLLLLEH